MTNNAIINDIFQRKKIVWLNSNVNCFRYNKSYC